MAMPDATLHLAAMILGATIGLLLVVNAFRLAAGVRFTHWRHVLAAYAAGLLWATCASEQAIGFLLAAPIAIALELMLFRRRSAATQASSL
jgi:hypothetical protein